MISEKIEHKALNCRTAADPSRKSQRQIGCHPHTLQRHDILVAHIVIHDARSVLNPNGSFFNSQSDCSLAGRKLQLKSGANGQRTLRYTSRAPSYRGSPAKLSSMSVGLRWHCLDTKPLTWPRTARWGWPHESKKGEERRFRLRGAESGFSDTESMPCSMSHLARSGWSDGPWPQIPTYLKGHGLRRQYTWEEVNTTHGTLLEGT